MSWLILGGVVFLSMCDCVKFSDYSLNIKMQDTSVNVEQKGAFVEKHVLSNGMVVLVCEAHNVPKVSLQLWYNVGSKDEKTGEFGIAHLIEHMIFKGTDTLSEPDINIVTHMLSGSCNAFTSYDYTGYLFNFPTEHWKEALPIFADCMLNCRFADDMLNSEMKAVLQELKMRRDRYNQQLSEQLLVNIFSDHPYQHPIIGYKQDLWTVTSADLHAFYKKHYIPNNAVLVVVGDVKKDEVFKLSEQYFGAIEPNLDYKKVSFKHESDISSQRVVLYRDVKRPIVKFAFEVPGLKAKKNDVLEVIQRVLGYGNSSRLYKKLVNQLQLATDVSAYAWELFDHGLFYIICEIETVDIIPEIEKVILHELDDIRQNGFGEEELRRGARMMKSSFYSLLENNEEQAYEIGKYYLATGDENFVFTCMNRSFNELKKEADLLVKKYFRPTVMHRGILAQLPEDEKVHWQEMQKNSDAEDQAILSARFRDTEIEDPSYAHTVTVQEAVPFSFPHPQKIDLKNGAKLLYYNNPTIPKIEIGIRFKSRSFYDPEGKEGTYNFIARMLQEGIEGYTADQFADFLEAHGMSFHTYPGGLSLSLLRDDFEVGLDIIKKVLLKATFDKKEIEKVRKQIEADIHYFWDNPNSFYRQIIKEHLYQDHPYSRDALGTSNSIASITREDLVSNYKKWFTPVEATVVIVGDLRGYNVPEVVEKQLKDWVGNPIAEVPFPVLQKVAQKSVSRYMNRDQVVLAFAQISIDRMNPDYDALLLFEQIFSGGSLGSLHSRLYQLREQSGLFYNIGGSFIAGSDEQPGMFLVKTLVSIDRLEEAKNAIKALILEGAESLTDQELEEAKRAVATTLIDNFVSNESMASAYLYLERFNLPENYFDMRIKNLAKITVNDVQKAVQRIVSSNNFFEIEIGRVEVGE